MVERPASCVTLRQTTRHSDVSLVSKQLNVCNNHEERISEFMIDVRRKKYNSSRSYMPNDSRLYMKTVEVCDGDCDSWVMQMNVCYLTATWDASDAASASHRCHSARLDSTRCVRPSPNRR